MTVNVLCNFMALNPTFIRFVMESICIRFSRIGSNKHYSDVIKVKVATFHCVFYQKAERSTFGHIFEKNASE